MIRGVPREKLQQIIDHLAIRRFGTFRDVAHVIDFFVHPASDNITGQVLYLAAVGDWEHHMEVCDEHWMAI